MGSHKTRLSVNVNKIALLRNSRGANVPDLAKFARWIEDFGAEGITIHPRPDERHIKYSDVPLLKSVIKTEFNIEGNPSKAFMKLVLDNVPEQCTLVPDSVDQLTSDHGWNTVLHKDFLTDVTAELKAAGIRVSLFVDPEIEQLEGAKVIGADRIEFYTGPYANDFHTDPALAVKKYTTAALKCEELGLGINAGHDLDLKNLKYFKNHVPGLLEVSIGHALVRDALIYGIQNAVQLYMKELN